MEINSVLRSIFEGINDSFDYRIHLNQPKGGPEGYDNGDFLRKWALNKNATSFKIVLNENAKDKYESEI